MNPINNNINMSINFMNHHSFPNPPKNFEDIISKEEFDNLKKKYSILLKELDELRLKSNYKVNETMILESSAFESIVSQADYDLTLLEQIKELYLKLKSKYDESFREYNVDIKKIEDRILKNNDNFKRKYYDIKEENFKLSRELVQTKAKFAELESLSQDVPNFDSVFNLFESEKIRVNSELTNLMKLFADIKERLDTSLIKISNLEEENLTLKQENEVLKTSGNNNLNLNENPPEEKKYNQKDLLISIKQKKEKLVIIERKYNKLKEDNNNEKRINESLLKEIEANEKGLNDMTGRFKQMQQQISNENQKVAKLTKDKINDQKQIEKLLSERELNKQLVENIKNQKKELEEQQIKLEEEIQLLKLSIDNCNEAIIAKDKELLTIEEYFKVAEKKSKELESLYDQEKKVNVELLKNNSQIKSEVDLSNKKLKTSYSKEYNTPEKIKELENDLELYKVSFILIIITYYFIIYINNRKN